MAVTSNLVIDQGANFTVTINYSNDEGVPNNLTGYTARAQMRKSYYSANSISFTSSFTDAANGEIMLSMTPALTANIKAGRYVYDLTVSSNVTVLRIVEGIVTVLPGVTR
jgi:hypothetical protein